MTDLHALAARWRDDAAKLSSSIAWSEYAEGEIEGEQSALRTCADELSAALAVTGWRAIETAPKSTVENGRVRGVFLLGFCPDEAIDPQSCMSVIWWEPLTDGGVWYGQEAIPVRPTHWMPLPPEPPR